MHRFVVSPIILLFIGISTASAQWNWQSPVPQGNNLTSIEFTDTTYGWASGEYGTILHTTNGGAVWYEQEFGRTDNMLRAAMISPDLGWAVGDNGTILTTTDGGDDWVEQSSGITTGLNAITFIDSLRGWAAGDEEVILHTTNGGATWNAQHQSAIPSSINDIRFISPDEGWAVGSNRSVFHTTDGGATWSKQTIGILPAYYTSISFGYPSLGVIVGSGGAILRTDNGGTSWSAVTSGVSSVLNQTLMQNAFVGWAVGDNGVLLRTVNGGLSWSKFSVGDGGNLTGITLASGRLWTAGEYGHILRSRNGGFSWNELDSGSRLSVNWLDFADATVGAAVGQTGLILRTTDAGQSWNQQSSPTPSISCYGIKLTDATHGWSVGDNGTILRTVNGQVWSAQSSGVTHTLFGITFSGTSGWIVGGEFASFTGVILHSSDSGNSWNIQSSGVSDVLYGVNFPTATDGWAVGENGLILHTTTGGANWSPQTSGTFNALYWCFFRDAINGWAVGDMGTILRTTNAGSVWTGQSSGTTEILYSIVASSDRHAMVCGSQGVTLETTDGGNHWEAQYSRTPYGLFGVVGSSDTTFWACGDYGTILKYTEPGPISATISGSVFNDYNKNGQRDPGEPGLSGWRVNLGGLAVDSATADSEGAFSFKDLLFGSYTLSEVAQPSWTQTAPRGSTYAITVNPSAARFTGNFGNHAANSFGYTLYGGWNLLSIPIMVADPRKNSLFPTAISGAFSFVGSYQMSDTMYRRLGYWIKFATPQAAGINGADFHSDTLSVQPGWNLIGSISDTLPTNPIISSPANLITSRFFVYRGSYVSVPALIPGQGHWVKCGDAGVLILSGATTVSKSTPDLPLQSTNTVEHFHQLMFSDRSGARGELYFNERSVAHVSPEDYGLPPRPPQEAFDVRFNNDSQVAVFEDATRSEPAVVINIQSSHYPVTLSWKFDHTTDGSYECRDPQSGARIFSSDVKSGTMTITDSTRNKLVVRRARSRNEITLPESFVLFQNSPNPFNPSTTIKFGLPFRSRVQLRIYNLLGEEILTLAEGDFDAGYHEVRFAPASASGIYFYRIDARELDGEARFFSQTKKMIILK